MFDAKVGMPLGTFLDLQKAGKDAGIADPDILVALAHAENGPKGFELGYGVGKGVRSIGQQEPNYVDAPGSQDQYAYLNPHYGVQKQMSGAAFQLKKTEERFFNDMKAAPTDSEGHYTDDFMKYFSWGGKALGHPAPSYNGYAPLRAHDTDPNSKNANHYGNLQGKYRSMKQGK